MARLMADVVDTDKCHRDDITALARVTPNHRCSIICESYRLASIARTWVSLEGAQVLVGSNAVFSCLSMAR